MFVACVSMVVCVLTLTGADVGVNELGNVDVVVSVGAGLIIRDNKFCKGAGALSGLLMIESAPRASRASMATTMTQAGNDFWG